MYLRETSRGRGAGRRLLAVALSWARDQKIKAIRLDTTDESTAEPLVTTAAAVSSHDVSIPRTQSTSRSVALSLGSLAWGSLMGQ